MSNVHRVQNIFIGDGSAIPAGGTIINPTNVLAGDLAIAGVNMAQIATTATVADSESIYIVEGRAGGKLKRSMEIPGRKVTSYLGASYTPATRDVWAIGYNRETATGSIDVTNDAEYMFYLRPLHEKNLYSERILRRSYSFVSAVAATQLSIATQIAGYINSDLETGSVVSAVVVGNGTGAYGLTGATNYGVEVTSDLQPQNVTRLSEDRVYFDIELESTNSAFGATPVARIQGMTYGKGTPNQIAIREKKNLSYEGVLNYTKWPIPLQTYSTVSTLVTSANITATTGNVTATSGLDVVTVATSTATLRPGEIIDINGIEYEIKYIINTTTFVITAPATATYTGANLKVKYGYDNIVIEFSNPNLLEGAGVLQDSRQSVIIAFPAINSGGAYTANSTQGSSIITTLNAYFASLHFAALTL